MKISKIKEIPYVCAYLRIEDETIPAEYGYTIAQMFFTRSRAERFLYHFGIGQASYDTTLSLVRKSMNLTAEFDIRRICGYGEMIDYYELAL